MTLTTSYDYGNGMSGPARPTADIGSVDWPLMPITASQESEIPTSLTATSNFKLGRLGDGAAVTRPTRFTVNGRLEDGTTPHFTPTCMARLISTCIPLYQPDGRLAVPPDDWAELRAIVEDEGGSLDFEETSKRGFIFGGHHGLPVYAVSISVPDGIDEADIIGRVDPALKAIIRRNLMPVPEHQGV